MSISRRQFLGTTAMAGSLMAAEAGKSPLPVRVLGRTGVRVTTLAMGAGSRFLMYKDEDKALEAMQRALDLGITYIDTADDYGKDHLSEQRVGKAIRGRRQGLFIATKLSSRDGAESFRIGRRAYGRCSSIAWICCISTRSPRKTTWRRSRRRAACWSRF
jgi:Predicted oxidoreductases (related to aryl-alcohol dehydrogenases)